MLAFVLLISFIFATLHAQNEIAQPAQKNDAVVNADPVRETPIEQIRYRHGEYSDDIGIQNVIVKPNALYMRYSVKDSSALHWNIKNQEKEWAFALTFNEPNLLSTEKCGIYLRYTSEPPIVGHFRGGESKFHGMVVGLEFEGAAVKIVYFTNDGIEYNLPTHPDLYVRSDIVNPLRFKNVETITMKVISSNSYLKVELYDGDRILYDNFRVHHPERADLFDAGKYFGIIADYERVSSGKAFVLKDAQLYKRQESSSYDPFKIHAKPVDESVRDMHEIEHPDDDIRSLISEISLHTAYFKNVFGDLPNTTIRQIEDEVLKDLESLGMQVGRLKELNAINKKIRLTGRVNEMNLKISGIKNLMAQIENTVVVPEAHLSLNSWILYGAIFLAGVLFCREIDKFLKMRASFK